MLQDLSETFHQVLQFPIEFPMDFHVGSFEDQFALYQFTNRNRAAIIEVGGIDCMFKGLTYDDVYWVLENKWKEANGQMVPDLMALIEKVTHHVDATTKKMTIDTTRFQNPDGTGFGVFTIGPIQTHVELKCSLARWEIQWPAHMPATEAQIKLIKDRNWSDYIGSFSSSHAFMLDITLLNKGGVWPENSVMARIFAKNTGHVQVNVSDYIFINNSRTKPAQSTWRICEKNSMGILRVYNEKLGVCINV